MAPVEAVQDQPGTETSAEQRETQETPAASPHAAGSESPGVQASADGETEQDAVATELIPREQYDQLKTDPAKLEKELVRAVNKKFREVAEQRKALEPYADFIQALDRDAKGTVVALAKQLGIQIPDVKPADEPAKGTTTDIGEIIMTDVRKALGPEYEDLADRLAPAMRRVAETVARVVAEPIARKQEEIISESATRETQSALAALTQRHPDWKDHEQEMVALGEKFPPGQGVTEVEYLDTLYFLATREKQNGEAVRRTVDRMKKSAESAKPPSSVQESHVAVRPPGPPSFREAYEAAKRGERLE